MDPSNDKDLPSVGALEGPENTEVFAPLNISPTLVRGLAQAVFFDPKFEPVLVAVADPTNGGVNALP